jgi:hypothetical protein
MSVPTIFISIFFIVAYLGGSWSKNVGCTVSSLFCVIFNDFSMQSRNRARFCFFHNFSVYLPFIAIRRQILIGNVVSFWLVMLCHVASLWFIPYILASLINHL